MNVKGQQLLQQLCPCHVPTDDELSEYMYLSQTTKNKT